MKKMLDTKHINTNSVLRVYKKGFGYSRLVVIENNEYYLAAICYTDMVDNVNDGDLLEAYLWEEDKLSYDFELTLIGKITVGKKILFFNHTNTISTSHGRKCIGMQCEIPIEFFVFDTGDESKTISTEDVVFFDGNIIWLEDREAVLRSRIHLPDVSFFKSHVKINNTEIEVLGKIEMLNPVKNIYNIMYTGMNEKDRNTILDHIFNSFRE